MRPSDQLERQGIRLPDVPQPVAAYVPATRVGDQIWTSGQLPLVNGELRYVGKLAEDLDVEQGMQAARTCALNALAAAAQMAGGIDNIQRVVKVTVFVASAPEFTQQPVVANGASELFAQVFGDAGAHVRSAVGVAALPLNAPVEVELVVQV